MLHFWLNAGGGTWKVRFSFYGDDNGSISPHPDMDIALSNTTYDNEWLFFSFSIDNSGHRVVYVKRGSDNSVLINETDDRFINYTNNSNNDLRISDFNSGSFIYRMKLWTILEFMKVS